MIREAIKKEIDRKGWSISRLATETGIRYPSITEWLNGNKELSTINLTKILNTLEMKIAKKTSGSRSKDYRNLVASFDGKKLVCCETEMEIPESYIAYQFFGVLVRKAAKEFAQELGLKELNYGQVYEKFCKRTLWEDKSIKKDKMVLDIPLSICLPNFTRIADRYFSEKERNLVAILLTYKFPEDLDKEYAETQFMSALMKEIEFVD